MSGGTPSKRVHDLAMLNEWDPSDFNDTSFDIIRMPKVPRTEADSKRSQLFQKYRVQSSSSLNTSQSDHTVNPEARVELGDFIRDNNNTKDAYNTVNSHQREFGRESLTTEDKIETVSENKVDVEGDDRLKERDRKMKDGKQSEKLGKDRKDLQKEEDLDKECKEKRIEKDGDNEGDKSEKQSKGFDKDLDVQESADDKDKEAFNHGVQERKRMLRPKGSRSQDNDGSIGKSDVPAVVYSVGGCLQVFIRLWKEYETSSNISGKAPETSKCGPTLEICIPAEHVSATNRQVKGSQLWGTDIYTGDSDLVAVLMHTGYCRPTASPPPPAIQELRATVRVLPPQDCYASTLRNNVRSRAWGAAIGCSFCVERCHIVKKGGGTIDLEPCLAHTSTVEPTLAPVVVERTITTRAAASNALRQQRFVREVTLQYNLCNEPWIKYSISAIADKGLKKPLFTSARLKKGEVLYLESRTRRYELCFNGEKMVKAGNGMETNGVDTDNNNNNNNNSNNLNNMVDVFRWSECKKPLPQKVMRSIGIPLPPEHLLVLEENLDWEDIQWSQTGVWISGNEHPLSRVHFLSPA